ncbi:MAG: ABC-F family ATP-binding cassette domain-containing protein [Kofleriaceae bacterium]|nr:ABC-F family ATP-binding cassette domain-containing protein [Kofleriaceae bacterium]
MSILTAENLYKSYGAQVVLEGIGLVLQPGERVGLLGVNGCGKSTLVKILAGVEQADSGTVLIRKGATVGYFSQEPDLDPSLTVREVVAEGLGEWRVVHKRYEEISTLLENEEGDIDALLEEQARMAADIERLGGWERMHQVESVLTNLGVSKLDAMSNELSGGEKRRVALARLLVSEPDLAIIDEPTNHLDVQTIEWLEEQLVNNFSGALLFITHDRYMLDHVAQRIIEIDRREMFSYRGGWEAYLEAKAERSAHEERTEANRQNFLRTELEWLSRSPQARTTKQKARIKRAVSVRDKGAPEAQAAIAKIELQDSRTGRTIIDIRDLRLEMGGKVLIENLDLCLSKGDRIGIVGANGIGKTSLLRAILGQLKPVAGTIKLGETMKVGYFEQARANLDMDASIFENVIGNRGDVQVGKDTITPHAYLGRFMFARKRVRDKVSMLSGGERARVALAKMLIEPVNLLLLDEPTNDLDVGTLSALEEMLVSTVATAIVVTHDRYFLDRVATGVLAFEGDGKVVQYASAQQALEGSKRSSKKAAKAKAKSIAAQSVPTGTGKRTYAERIELDGILDKIAAGEEAVEKVNAELAAPDLYTERGSEVPGLNERLAVAQKTLEQIVERWEYLESKD